MITPPSQMDRITEHAIKSVQDRGQDAPIQHILLAGLDRQDQRAAARNGHLVDALGELTRAIRDGNGGGSGNTTRRQRAARMAIPGTTGAGILAVVLVLLQQLGVTVP